MPTPKKALMLRNLKTADEDLRALVEYLSEQLTHRTMDCDQEFPIEITLAMGQASTALITLREVERVVELTEEIGV